MLTLDKIVCLLQDRRLNVVSERTGIHINTLSNIRTGKMTNPTYKTVRLLSDYFSGEGSADG